MDNNAELYLNYLQASLADASRLTPNLTDDELVEVASDALLAGEIDPHSVKALSALATKRQVGNRAAGDPAGPIPVLVCPCVYGLRPEHGRGSERLPARIAPIVLSATLTPDGRLVDDDRIKAPVLVPRNLLEPTPWEVTIGTVDDADTAYAGLDPARGAWRSLVSQADALLNGFTGQTLADLEIDGYERLEVGVVFPRGPGGATWAIELLVDRLRGPEAPAVPLLDALLRQAPDRKLLTARQQLARSAQHVGQMEYRYGLADSQRESLAHHLAGDTADVLAVDGPPGTGKTTLLLSAIATAWVDAALRGAEPPIVVATSTNNQAVLNILRAFAEVVERPGPFSGRWLGQIESYGLYLPSKSKEAVREHFPVHAMKGMGKQAVYDAQAHETEAGLQAARAAFLAHAQRAFPALPGLSLGRATTALQAELARQADTVKNAVAALQRLSDAAADEPVSSACVAAMQARADAVLADLRTGCETTRQRVDGLKQVRSRWQRHCAEAPWWQSLLATLGVGQPRARRDLAFWADAEIAHGALIGTQFRQRADWDAVDAALITLLDAAETGHGEALRALDAGQAFKAALGEAVATLRQVVPEPGDLTLEAVQAALDVGPRYTAFKVATHYWEARYLAEVEDQLARFAGMDDSKSPEKLLRHYRRLAKLFPCFVATLYTLPHRFNGYLADTKPLYNAIDLLIVDEAGQVPPEIGVPSFALARRALVVGDIDQIKPIWAVPRALDLANAARHGAVPAMGEAEPFLASGLAASAGSLMQLAQRATPFAKYPKRGRGMFLCEHRRCWPEIISICNRLAYQGLLLPRREEGPRRILPSVGYVHLPGVATRNGKSRSNPVEASAIAKWLAQRRASIETAFAADGKTFGQLVAVVTPFSAQARQVRRMLERELGKDHGVTVGTVHALQGAERRIVIFSPTYGLGTTPGRTFFDADPSILNVAISRAQDAFLIFGNMHLFQPTGSHPSAIVGKMLLRGGDNEISDVPAELLAPGFDMSPAALIRDLDAHRAVLDEAFRTARTRLVIVSPFLATPALEADRILDKVSETTGRGVSVTVVSDPGLNQRDAAEYQRCLARLEAAGARIRIAQSQGVHSKLILVDYAWLVVGSFNWLSAVRNGASSYARYESSVRYDGHEAFQMIGRSLHDLRDLVAAA
ncbi:AAA domain-containing protein [Ralstonia pseudosolanacearum]|uniref:AAA domain-containing protein n=1 Tax=Ralstonia pseudosolanacearum TaxID=1310165 RepID=UPI001FFB7361|nr:AAA domain-containing protein [Ralstonia pseudosolanacearum]